MPAPTKHLLTVFDTLHQQQFGERALISGARDGKILADLHKTHPDLIEPLMAAFVAERDPWVMSTFGCTIPGFRYRFAALLAKHAPRLRSQRQPDWREDCARTCGGTCATEYLHHLRRPD